MHNDDNEANSFTDDKDQCTARALSRVVLLCTPATHKLGDRIYM
jgi:hypothetical protein